MSIQGFRALLDVSLVLDRRVSTLVGENATGKSTIGLAIERLLRNLVSHLGEDAITREDFPYGVLGPLAINATIELAPQEAERLLIEKLTPSGVSGSARERLARWLRGFGNEITLTLTRPDPPGLSALPTRVWWGNMTIWANQMRIGDEAIVLGGSVRHWTNFAAALANGGISEESLSSHLEQQFVLDETPMNMLAANLGEFLRNSYKLVPEFRFRSTGGFRATMESWEGPDVASVLVNLKNSRKHDERERYDLVKSTFNRLFPRYTIEAVMSAPGPSTPTVLFYEKGRPNPVPLEQGSAGAYQTLNIVANLVGREGLTVFLEHPEQHLHPHSVRFMNSLIQAASERNQIIITTHDCQLVDPQAPDRLSRFWRTEKGIQVRWPHLSGLDSREAGQFRTALRRLDVREVVFARAAILVEDESQHRFFLGLGAKLGCDLDAEGVSIVDVGGEDGFKSFRVLLDGLGIPYVCLRDLSWGASPEYPPERFFSFGAELEDFLDRHGLEEKRRSIIEEMGRSKQRVAAELAGRITSAEIPPIFSEVARRAIELAKAGHL